MRKTLDVEQVVATIGRLEKRIGERFPNSGLRGVCQEFQNIAANSKQQIDWIAKPNWVIRFSVALIIALVVATFIYSLKQFDIKIQLPSLAELIQITEALINDIILVGAALFFLISLEIRIKRSRSLQALHTLRSLAHVVDMHQLTKDPSTTLTKHEMTNSSPQRTLSPFLLKRYLDYCSELLSLIGKVAALYSQRLPDSAIVSAASEIEELCTGLSRKIWQKIVVIDN